MYSERKDLKTDLISEERQRLIYFVVNEAKIKYKQFKNSNGNASQILYAADYKPMSGKGYNAGELELMLPGDFYITVKSSAIYSNLVKVFDLDRMSSDIETGTGMDFTDLKTGNLDRFRKEHPDSKLKIEYMSFDLIAFDDEVRKIIRTRFSDPVTKEPLTEVWEASRYSFML